MANIVGESAKLVKVSLHYFEKLFPYVDTAIKQSKEERKAAEEIFRKTVAEIYGNLSILGKFRLDIFKNYTINSPEIREVVNKDLKTEYTEQFYKYTKKFKRLKKKDKKNFDKKLELALSKINEMRTYAAMSTKKIKGLKKFRPAVRLKNIQKVYDDMRKILASANR